MNSKLKLILVLVCVAELHSADAFFGRFGEKVRERIEEKKDDHDDHDGFGLMGLFGKGKSAETSDDDDDEDEETSANGSSDDEDDEENGEEDDEDEEENETSANGSSDEDDEENGEEDDEEDDEGPTLTNPTAEIPENERLQTRANLLGGETVTLECREDEGCRGTCFLRDCDNATLPSQTVVIRSVYDRDGDLKNAFMECEGEGPEDQACRIPSNFDDDDCTFISVEEDGSSQVVLGTGETRVANGRILMSCEYENLILGSN